MKHKAIVGWALGGLLCAAPVTASASEILVVYEGTVAQGSDGLGLFGAVGSSLAGQPYTVFYDFSVDTVGALTSSTAEHDVIYGGSSYGVPSPLRSVSVTIAGITQVMKGDTTSDVGIFRDFSNYLETTAFDTPFTAIGGNVISYFDTVFGTYLSRPVDLANSSVIQDTSTGGITVAGDPTVYSGFFDFYGIGGASTTGQFANGAAIRAVFLKATEDAPLAAAAAVPEPASWLMMIVGFGAVGAMMRRKALGRLRVSYSTT